MIQNARTTKAWPVHWCMQGQGMHYLTPELISWSKCRWHCVPALHPRQQYHRLHPGPPLLPVLERWGRHKI